MAYAVLSDVRIYAPNMDGDDEVSEKVDTLLAQAEARVRVDFPDLDMRVADGRTVFELLVQVEAEMVASVMRNPMAYQSESEGVSGLSESHTFNLAAASGLLEFTERQRALVASEPSSSASGSGRAFTIRPGPR